jgi:hypothetical protein
MELKEAKHPEGYYEKTVIKAMKSALFGTAGEDVLKGATGASIWIQEDEATQKATTSHQFYWTTLDSPFSKKIVATNSGIDIVPSAPQDDSASAKETPGF